MVKSVCLCKKWPQPIPAIPLPMMAVLPPNVLKGELLLMLFVCIYCQCYSSPLWDNVSMLSDATPAGSNIGRKKHQQCIPCHRYGTYTLCITANAASIVAYRWHAFHSLFIFYQYFAPNGAIKTKGSFNLMSLLYRIAYRI